MAKWILRLVVLLVIVAGAAGAAAWWLRQQATTPFRGFASDEVFVDIPSGTGPRSIGARLAEAFFQAGIPLVETGTIQRREGMVSPGERELEWAVFEADLAGSAAGADLQRLKRIDQQAWAEGTRVLHVPTYFAWGRA